MDNLQNIISLAVSEFKQLDVSNYTYGDKFFEKFGCGNTTNIINKPFERFVFYETLLKNLHIANSNKYDRIHKGTPFYFLAWTAFDFRNYEKAVFYMDAAISEDIRKDPDNWSATPAGQFLTLTDGNQVATRITNELKRTIQMELDRFNSISNLPAITLTNFINYFIKPFVCQKENHAIITALYSYILEYGDRENEISIRSSEGGSIEPLLTFLFKGGLLFESILKNIYPNKDNGTEKCKTLGDIFNTNNFKCDFNITIQQSANSLDEIIQQITDDDIQTSFNTTSKLRNTTGHNLVWDDIFNETANFKKLFEQQVNAILYTLHKKFIFNHE